MIVYKETKDKFLTDVIEDNIEDIISRSVSTSLKMNVSNSEYQSWANSLPQVEQILRDPDIPHNAGIAIEYSIPRTQNRIDFIITGRNASGKNTLVLIELKQWAKAELTTKDGIINTRFAQGNKDTLHPSYQAWSYASLLNSFNTAVYEGDISLKPCAYLHNYKDDGVLTNTFYNDYLQKAPLFFKVDKKGFREYIKSHIKTGDTDNIIEIVENAEIRPSKQLADQLDSMIKGNEEFVLIDSQKEIFEEAKQLNKKASVGSKQVFIVIGGPGTGKSVLAINLLAYFTNTGAVAQYVTRNSAPREVYQAKLTGSMKKSVFSSMFQGSGAYYEAGENCYDALIVDEAHRLNYKSGLVGHLGENQVKEIINAANFSVFFLDEDQRVTLKDIGSEQEIKQWAEHYGAGVTIAELTSQFRCAGSDGYLAWLDNALGIKPTANKILNTKEYDFRIYNNPTHLREDIIKLNTGSVVARLVAGYCWPWVTKSSSKRWKEMTPGQRDNTYDISFPGFNFAMRWNLHEQGQGWLNYPESINEVGCIHTCQGLEVDYIGVIVGDDFKVCNGQIEIEPSAHPGADKALQKWRQIIQEDPVNGRARVESIIKNTYRTLMTRGQKGCYLYCTDKETSDYFASLVKQAISEMPQNNLQAEQTEQPQPSTETYPGLTLKLLNKEDVKPYKNAVPIYHLEIAAGQFSEQQNIEENIEDVDWVELPDSFSSQPGLFVARVVGESMNKRIPNGAWCLFKANPAGSRNDKIVVVQHRDIQDADTGASYTVKRYSSEKVGEGDEWRHSRIVLKPESYMDGYENLVFEGDEVNELRVVGEFVAVI